MIGKIIHKDNPAEMAQYTETAIWCNANSAHIEDKGEYYEVCENVPYVPTKEEQIAELTAEYTAEKTNLCEAYTTASMMGDTETAQSIAADMADLNEWYDEEYERIINESEAE